HAGQDHVDFGSTEPHTVLFHEPGSSSVWVNIGSTKGSCRDKQDCENYITLLEKQNEGLLACGTNARHPSCWILRKLYVNSQWEVSQVPLDLCEVYTGGCHGCLMARDPYCGWYQDRCVSIYSSQEGENREGAGPVASCFLSLSLPSNSRPVLQSINPVEPHKGCPNPKPEQAPLQKVSLAQNSRYYLSCPMESRHATYSWRHENSVEQSCEPGHQSPNCILFIENLTDLH
ncbi:hypothetical protein Celaphus_00015373, partial [Cervus elaphus hippelaphus]